jgi:hypothetical protein
MMFWSVLAIGAAWLLRRLLAQDAEPISVGPAVDVTCLWCMQVAVQKVQPRVGEVDPVPCQHCGQAVSFMVTDASGRWVIS